MVGEDGSVDVYSFTKARSPRERALLSRRILEVFLALRDGLRARDIAKRLGVSIVTVRVHMEAVYEVFGVESQAEVIQLERERAERPAEDLARDVIGPNEVNRFTTRDAIGAERDVRF